MNISKSILCIISNSNLPPTLKNVGNYGGLLTEVSDEVHDLGCLFLIHCRGCILNSC